MCVARPLPPVPVVSGSLSQASTRALVCSGKEASGASEEEVTRLMSHADSNGDGEVDYTEFMHLFVRQQQHKAVVQHTPRGRTKTPEQQKAALVSLPHSFLVLSGGRYFGP